MLYLYVFSFTSAPRRQITHILLGSTPTRAAYVNSLTYCKTNHVLSVISPPSWLDMWGTQLLHYHLHFCISVIEVGLVLSVAGGTDNQKCLKRNTDNWSKSTRYPLILTLSTVLDMTKICTGGVMTPQIPALKKFF